jgi:hypothetical protein
MKKTIGFALIGLALIIMLINHYFIIDNQQIKILSFSTIIAVIIGVILLIPFDLIPIFIFDNKEWEQNKTVEKLVEKLRLRAVLFNNISVIIFFVTIIVIITGFYLLIHPPSTNNNTTISLTIRISASVLLIFLVQILFRVFKYLLRVAAFYNGKADALEFYKIKPELPLDKLMDLFTPDKYDITDLQQSSITDNLIEIAKGKVGK